MQDYQWTKTDVSSLSHTHGRTQNLCPGLNLAELSNALSTPILAISANNGSAQLFYDMVGPLFCNQTIYLFLKMFVLSIGINVLGVIATDQIVNL